MKINIEITVEDLKSVLQGATNYLAGVLETGVVIPDSVREDFERGKNAVLNFKGLKSVG